MMEPDGTLVTRWYPWQPCERQPPGTVTLSKSEEGDWSGSNKLQIMLLLLAKPLLKASDTSNEHCKEDSCMYASQGVPIRTPQTAPGSCEWKNR